MKKLILYIFQWLIPAAFVALGVWLYRENTRSFLGILCFGVAALLCCYLAIRLLARRELMTAKILSSILTGIVAFAVLLAVVTGLFVAAGTQGTYEEEMQYVLVLGNRVEGTEPSAVLTQRIEAAYVYLSIYPDAVAVLTGGKGNDEGISEAACMYRELTEKGIAPERLWLEERSTSTWENLEYSLELIRQKTGIRPDKIGIISSETHLFRARLQAKAFGVEATGIHAVTEDKVCYANYFLREIAAIWKFYILGG